MADSYRIGVLDKAYAVLLALTRQPKTPSELAAELELPWNTVYRLVRNLESKGILAQIDGKRFGLRFTFLHELQHVYEARLRDTARPILVSLARESKETAYLTVREGLEAVCVDRVESPQPLQLSVTVGTVQPLNAGAVGKLLLTYAPTEVRENLFSAPLRAVTPHTFTDPEELRIEIERVRETGLAASVGENTTGAASIAAPVFDANAELIAAVSIGGPTERVTGAAVNQLKYLVRRHAELLSKTLRGVPEQQT